MVDLPFTFTLPMPQVIPSRVDNYIERRLSALRGQFFDQDTYINLLSYIPMTPGGLRARTLAEWFSRGVVEVRVGSEPCPPQFEKEGKFDEINRRAAEFVQVVKSARV